MIHSIFDSILLYPRSNSILRESLILVEEEKGPKIAQKVSKIDKKGDFSSKTANIDSKYDSLIHSTIKFNSKDYSIFKIKI